MGMQWLLDLGMPPMSKKDVLKMWICPSCGNDLELGHCNKCNFDIEDDVCMVHLWVDNGRGEINRKAIAALQEKPVIENIRIINKVLHISFFKGENKYEVEIPFRFDYYTDKKSWEVDFIVRENEVLYDAIEYSMTQDQQDRKMILDSIYSNKWVIENFLYRYFYDKAV